MVSTDHTHATSVAGGDRLTRAELLLFELRKSRLLRDGQGSGCQIWAQGETDRHNLTNRDVLRSDGKPKCSEI